MWGYFPSIKLNTLFQIYSIYIISSNVHPKHQLNAIYIRLKVLARFEQPNQYSYTIIVSQKSTLDIVNIANKCLNHEPLQIAQLHPIRFSCLSLIQYYIHWIFISLTLATKLPEILPNTKTKFNRTKLTISAISGISGISNIFVSILWAFAEHSGYAIKYLMWDTSIILLLQLVQSKKKLLQLILAICKRCQINVCVQDPRTRNKIYSIRFFSNSFEFF